MYHVMIEMDSTGLAAVLFQPKSGGRVGAGEDSFFYPANGEPGAVLQALDGLRAWLESRPPIAYVWVSPTLYGTYRVSHRGPPWSRGQVRSMDTVFWLLGDPPSVDSDPGLMGDCVKRICQLQAVLGRLQS